jgi:ketosteroid isomerase-like protein
VGPALVRTVRRNQESEMPEANNVEILREAYRRWADSKGMDADCWLDLVGDRVMLGSLAAGAPGMEFTRHRSDRAGVVAYLEGMLKAWEMLSYEISEYIDQGDRVVALGVAEFRDRSTGKAFTTVKADIFRFENGSIVEFFEFYDTAAALAITQP